MRAAMTRRYGPPEVVRIEEVDTPVFEDHEVLVRVQVTTVNRTDCGFRAATPFITRFWSGLQKPRNPILGTEFAGVVASVGRRVTSFGVGDRVFGFSESRFGAHAEYLAFAADGAIATIPDGVSVERAAAGTEGSHYALSFIRKSRAGRGQHVLVNGATGAIGSAAVQILKALGATVTAVCGADHVELVSSLGADRVIDLTAEDFTRDAVRYDVVLDAVGKSTFGRCKPILKPRGVYVSSDLGPYVQNPLLALVTPISAGSRGPRVIFPIPPRLDGATVRYLAGLMASGAFTPVIDRRYPLERIVDAYRYVETGQKVGNVLITVGPQSEPGSDEPAAEPRS